MKFLRLSIRWFVGDNMTTAGLEENDEISTSKYQCVCF